MAGGQLRNCRIRFPAQERIVSSGNGRNKHVPRWPPGKEREHALRRPQLCAREGTVHLTKLLPCPGKPESRSTYPPALNSSPPQFRTDWGHCAGGGEGRGISSGTAAEPRISVSVSRSQVATVPRSS